MRFLHVVALGLVVCAAGQTHGEGGCPDLSGLWHDSREEARAYRISRTDETGCGFTLHTPEGDDLPSNFSGSQLSVEVGPGMYYTTELRSDGHLHWAHDADAIWHKLDLCDAANPSLCAYWAMAFPNCSEAGKWSDHCSNDNLIGDNDISLTAACPHECASGNRSACTSAGDDCCVVGDEEKSCTPGFNPKDIPGLLECRGAEGYTCTKGYFFMPCTGDDQFAPENVMDSHCHCEDCDAGRGDEDVCTRGECEAMGCQWDHHLDQCESEHDDLCHCEEESCRANGFTWSDRTCGGEAQMWGWNWRPMGPKWGNHDPCKNEHGGAGAMQWAAERCCHNPGESSAVVCDRGGGGGSAGCTMLSQPALNMMRSKGYEPADCAP